MRKLIILLILPILFDISWGRTAAFEDSTARSQIARTFELTFLMQYEEAFSLVDSLEARFPDLPAVLVLRAGVLYCRMLDHEDALDMEEFEQQYDKAWAATEKLEKDGEYAEADLYFGTLLGFRALLYQRVGKWWKSVKTGMKSIGYLKDCLEADSTFSDAYLGLGTYKYWSSKATDFINWLPLIPDQKDEGIALMRKAMEEGLFGKEISRSTLAWTLIDAGRPQEAVNLSKEGLQKYPNSRYFLWTLASGYYKSGRLRKAEGIYLRIYKSIRSLERNNHYNELGICHRMGHIYLGLNKPEDALVWIDRGLGYEINDNVKKRRKKTLATLEDLKRRAEEQLEKTQDQ